MRYHRRKASARTITVKYAGRCAGNIRQTMVRDPGEDAADRWNESHS